MLNFYTDVRAYFGTLPGILEALIHSGLDLAMKCKAYAQGRLTKKVYSFIQAFISFCLISISSIEDKVIQYDFYLLTAQVALLFNMNAQAETLFKSAIGVFTDLPNRYNGQPIEEIMDNKIKNLISFLIVLPEDP
mmetsp:Transcript_18046/g.15767  ORF Transcript_18046/g.15767 Transcript_18046/m.15767 type:complete len:135 (-) Transcript_18046:568-972(-)